MTDDGLTLDDLAEYMGRLSSHPSYFTLAAFATGSPRMPAVGEHVAGCDTCRAVIEALALERGLSGIRKTLEAIGRVENP